MIGAIIRWSLNNRFMVLIATLMLVLAGLYSVKNTPVDAIPDLSDVQVIIKTSYRVKHRKWWKIKSLIH